jgi:hypothetical protein
MMRRHGVDEVHLAEQPAVESRRIARFQREADSQVGLPRSERLQRSRQRLVAQPQSRDRRQLEKGLHQFHHHRRGDDGVHRDGELRFPAGGDSLHAVGDRVDLGEQARSLAQQLRTGGGRLCLPRAAVEQQDIECLLELADPIGDCAGRQAEVTRGRGETSCLRHGLQQGQRVGSEGVAGCRHGLSIQLF